MTLAVLGIASVLTPGSAQAPAGDTFKSFTYAELGKEIRALRGKVAVVYFWGFT